jgi:phosphoglycolate phosphatase
MPDRGALVVIDVDNTIYDWVSIWGGAFTAMVRTLAQLTDRGSEQWLKAARAVHVRRSAIECPSLLADMASSAAWPLAIDASRVLPPAAAAYNDYWDHHLTAYPGTREALTELTEQGHSIVAYTEGDVSIAASRLARLGLAGVIRRAFGRAALPPSPHPAWCLAGSGKHCPIAVDFVPREDTKPNPAGLAKILVQCGTARHDAVYVGDNLLKDVAMAKAVGTRAFWARYGTARDPEHVTLLERVAHWSAADVAAERSSRPSTIAPDATLDDPRELSEAVARAFSAAAHSQG